MKLKKIINKGFIAESVKPIKFSFAGEHPLNNKLKTRIDRIFFISNYFNQKKVGLINP